MKRIFLCIVIVLLSLNVNGQFAYIPDANFRAYLQEQFPNCMTGDSLDTQCQEVLELGDLVVSGLGISDLTGSEYFTNLVLLDCSENNLTWIPALPEALDNLECGNNQLAYLPELPDLLRHLVCNNNQLTHLPLLPDELFDIRVDSNQLIELPELPESLVYLWCTDNQLTFLPYLPAGLNIIHASNNQLTELPQLDHVNYVEAYMFNNNQIEVVPSLPSNSNLFQFENNNIHCLPVLPESMTGLFFIAGNPIQCLPNIPTDMWFDVNLPVCTSNNLHDCTFLRPVFGNVYHDQNDNCQLDQNELGLQSRAVQASNGATAISDFQGNYRLYLDTGSYSITQMPFLQTPGIWDVDCPAAPYQILVNQSVDSVPDIDFPNTAAENCHWLWVDIGSAAQHPCFVTNSYQVAYCNYGTASVTGVYLELEFPSEIIPISSSVPWQSLGNGLFRFELGDLDIDACGSFSVSDSVSCDAEVGFTTCVQAEIFPHSPCLTGTQTWDNSSVEVSAQCNGAELEFTISNTGTGNMSAPSNYRIYEDNALFVSDQSIQLNASQSLTVPVPATGKAYRLEADQSNGHPGMSLPRANVEGCGGPSLSLGQILPAYQDDIDDHVEIVCTELIAAFDPNDKTVVPAGFGISHLIHPNDSLLEYRIRFQNTGNDTAFNIEVVDTLPTSFLNPATFVSGVSSHPYTVRMHGNGIVTWRFENILLTDSTTNEVESHGFVKFKIRTRPNLTNGTVINNNAAIYFDYNAAILTNTSFLTISDVPLFASIQNVRSEIDLTLYPNPFSGNTTLLLGYTVRNGRLTILDAVGRKLREENVTGKSHSISRGELSSGVYLISVYDGERFIGSVRMSVMDK